MMEKSLMQVHNHMLGLGLGALAHAVTHANYATVDNEYWCDLSVLQAAHAAEILIKARIAQEHPLLIFEQLPKPERDPTQHLNFSDLAERGRTVDYRDLPNRLWSVAGIKLRCTDVYFRFGRIRNSIQHFASRDELDLGNETLKFIFEVIDPFINECWNLYSIDYNEDPEPYTYLVEGLMRREIKFLVSPKMTENVDDIEFFCSTSKAYKLAMEKRLKAARDGCFGVKCAAACV